MTKKQLAANVAKKTNVTAAVAEQVINSTLEEIREAVNNQETVHLGKFGNFKPTTRSARMGFNPKTREEISIPEKRLVKFTATKVFIYEE